MSDSMFGPDGFTADDISPQIGKTFAITGANSGIGLEAARLLGRAGARVLMLCRSASKAMDAIADLMAGDPQGTYEFVECDLASLKSIETAARTVQELTPTLDGLLLNAGVMMTPKRTLTEDGFEQQFGTNFLGHYALAAQLYPNVAIAKGRFVWLSSIAHKFGKEIPFDNLDGSKSYNPQKAYAVSKLSDLMGAFELGRRLNAAGSDARSFVCHPGWSATNLQFSGPGKILGLLMKPMNAIFAQPAEKGALPTVLCAVSPKATQFALYGPSSMGDMRGPVRETEIADVARDEAMAARLWDEAERLTGVTWPL